VNRIGPKLQETFYSRTIDRSVVVMLLLLLLFSSSVRL